MIRVLQEAKYLIVFIPREVSPTQTHIQDIIPSNKTAQSDSLLFHNIARLSQAELITSVFK
jgi:hypothetical protein